MNRRKVLQLSALSLASALSAPSVLSAGTRSKHKKRVLVLGGTGFLGPVIVNELIKKGHEVTLFNRGVSNPHLFPQLKHLKGDRELENQKGLQQLINTNDQWDWAVDTWQKSPKAVVDAAHILKNRIKHYQYVSTVSVYDDWHEVNITEDRPLNPVPAMPNDIKTEHRYAIRKTLSEIALKNIMKHRCSFYRSHGLRGESKRVQESKSEPYWQVKIARGGDMIVPAEAEYYQVTDMISLAQFMVHCGEQQHNGAFNVAYRPFLFRSFVDNIRDLLQSDVAFHWLPQKFLADNDAQIFRTNRAGRYRFNVERAIKHGLINRDLNVLTLDQLKGYRQRHPNDDFVFGSPGTYSISQAKELQLIKKWYEHKGRSF